MSKLKEVFARSFRCIGASYGLGAGIAGTENGAEVISNVLLAKHPHLAPIDCVSGSHALDPTSDLKKPRTESNIKNLQPYLQFHEKFYYAVLDLYTAGHRPLVIGGDHSLSIATLCAAQKFLSGIGKDKTLGVVWIDCHGDCHTHITSHSGNIHGMTLAVMQGLGHPSLVSLVPEKRFIHSQHISYIGIRDLEQEEKDLIESRQIRAFWMKDVHAQGIESVCTEAILRMAEKVDAFVVSFDLDVGDPSITPGVGLPFPDGLKQTQIDTIIRSVQKIPNLLSFEIVEYNPSKDDAAQTTRELAVSIVEGILSS